MKNHWKDFVANRIPTISLSLIAAFGLMIQVESPALGQGLRRQTRVQRQLQKKLDKQKANQIAPSSDKPSTNPDQEDQPQRHSLDGISKLGPRALFKPDEVAMMIPGFGSPPAMMILMRQLDLTEDQRAKFRALKQQIGPKLNRLHAEKRDTEAQLEDAIYGENFDPQRVETLAAQSAEKTAEIIKTQAYIESQFRQILTPDQFFVFRYLVGEMVLPQRRLTPQQLRQMQQRRLGAQPNAPNRPPNQDLPQDK
ncbi:MAG: Spy/CpxP family protein refolding chaperone [Acidobacteria bacterium]|nr:Spy/CpxP family protein refolding chaperone [Acidobacteriota bacterium]